LEYTDGRPSPGETLLLEQRNAYLPLHDMTGHAVRVLMTRASERWRPSDLRDCTVVTSTEPCPMCAGAMYCVGVGRVVYGLSEARLLSVTGLHPGNQTLDIPCRTVLNAGTRPFEVVGPFQEDEAEVVHEGAWT
jgi:tRNA(Arg) A34 adenosine deaminase TadA